MFEPTLNQLFYVSKSFDEVVNRMISEMQLEETKVNRICFQKSESKQITILNQTEIQQSEVAESFFFLFCSSIFEKLL